MEPWYGKTAPSLGKTYPAWSTPPRPVHDSEPPPRTSRWVWVAGGLLSLAALLPWVGIFS